MLLKSLPCSCLWVARKRVSMLGKGIPEVAILRGYLCSWGRDWASSTAGNQASWFLSLDLGGTGDSSGIGKVGLGTRTPGFYPWLWEAPPNPTIRVCMDTSYHPNLTWLHLLPTPTA